MKDRLNIGLFVDAFFPMIDGVVSVVDNYAKRLCKFANVTVFTVDNGKFDCSTLPYKVVRCKTLKFGKFDYVLGCPSLDKNFKKELENANLDIVHIHSPFSIGKAGVKYSKKHHIPCVATFHSNYRRDFYSVTKSKFITNCLLKSIMKVFNQCNICFTINNFAKQLFIDYGCTTPIEVVSNATEFLPSDNIDVKGFENKYNIDEDTLVLLYVGRIMSLKGLDFILESLTKLPGDVNYKMFFMGGGNELNKFIKKANNLNLQDKVVFLGKIINRVDQLPIWERSDLFFLINNYDTDGIVKIEASCYKTPTLALKNTGAGSAITDGVNGILIDLDSQQFVDAVMKCYNDRAYLKLLGENAYRDLYVNWDVKIEEVFEKYKEIIEDYASKNGNKES